VEVFVTLSQLEALSSAVGELLLEILPRPAGIRGDVAFREQGFDSMTVAVKFTVPTPAVAEGVLAPAVVPSAP
jgi:hypothetical protein